MPDVTCPRCRTDLHDHGAIAWPVEMDDPGRAIYRCATDGCGPLAVVEGDQVTWFYPDGGEELALLRAAHKTRDAFIEAVRAADRAPAASEEFGPAVAEEKRARAAQTAAADALDAYYAAHPEVRP